MQGAKLFVGNLNYSVTRENLGAVFAQYGQVVELKIIEDKGFGFIEMSNQQEAESAKAALDGFSFEGKALRVSEAKPQSGKRKNSFRRY